MNKNELEIERKFLIRMPDAALIEAQNGCKKVEIEQTYLKDKVRIRRWSEDNKTVYIKTFKEKINDLVRIEKESEISKEKFDELLLMKDPDRNTISKVRYRFPFENKLMEIDVFGFWHDRAFLEIELECEDEEFAIPPFIEVIKEVTADPRYRNSALAKEVPNDEVTTSG